MFLFQVFRMGHGTGGGAGSGGGKFSGKKCRLISMFCLTTAFFLLEIVTGECLIKIFTTFCLLEFLKAMEPQQKFLQPFRLRLHISGIFTILIFLCLHAAFQRRHLNFDLSLYVRLQKSVQIFLFILTLFLIPSINVIIFYY